MRVMDVDKLKPHPKNNYFFDDIEGESWTAFLESIETSGVIEPVIADVLTLTIVSGHQRVRACKALGIKQIIVDERGFESEDEMLKQLIECNIRQRGIGNVNPVKFGRCIRELERIYNIKHGGDRASGTKFPLKSQEDLAEELDMSTKQLRKYKSLTDLIPELQDAVQSGQITATTAMGFVKKLSPEEQKKLAEQIGDKGKVSGKEVESFIAEIKAKDMKIAELEQQNNVLDAANKRLAKESNQGGKVIEKTVEVEVFPDDYEDIKRQNKTFESDNQRLNREYKRVVGELAEAKNKVRELTADDGENKVIQSAQDSMENFSIATYEYIRRYGGNVWSFDKWADVPEATRGNFAKAIQMLSAFAQQMADNVAGIE